MKFNNPHVGKHTVAGTAVALEFDIGFSPSYVKVINITAKKSLEHIKGMDDASGFLVADTHNFVTSAGITLTERGFKLGVQASINIATNVLHYIAY